GAHTDLAAQRVWQELCPQVRACTISTDQHVTGRGRSVLEAGGNGILWVGLEGNALLAVVNDLAEPLAENRTQRYAAHWQLAVGVIAVAVRQVDHEQAI